MRTAAVAHPKMGRDFFFLNALFYGFVITGRAFGFLGILADNPGVFLIFNIIGIGSLSVAYACSGEISANARRWTTGAATVLLLLLYANYHQAGAAAAALSAQAGQLVAQGKPATELIRDLQNFEGMARFGLQLLAISTLV